MEIAEGLIRLLKALEFATKSHVGQSRKSGEPYIVHPIVVAAIVADITSDEAMVIAALLHDEYFRRVWQ